MTDAIDWDPSKVPQIANPRYAKTPLTDQVSVRMDVKTRRYIEDVYFEVRNRLAYESFADFARDGMYKWAEYCRDRYVPSNRQLQSRGMALQAILRQVQEDEERRAYDATFKELNAMMLSYCEDAAGGNDLAVHKLAEQVIAFIGILESIDDPYWRDYYRRAWWKMECATDVAVVLQTSEAYGQTSLVAELEGKKELGEGNE
jgi:hypothetical protein